MRLPTGGWPSGKPSALVWSAASRSRSGPCTELKYSNSLGPSLSASIASRSSGDRPEVMKSSSPPSSSRVVMAPKRAPVRARALSITSCRTVSGSRLSLMRRLASLRRDSRSRSASVSPGCSILPPS